MHGYRHPPGGGFNPERLESAPSQNAPYQPPSSRVKSPDHYNPSQNFNQKKEDIVFGKPSFPIKNFDSHRQGPHTNRGNTGFRGSSQKKSARDRERSNSPFAVNEKLDLYGNKKKESGFANSGMNNPMPNSRNNQNENMELRNRGFNQEYGQTPFSRDNQFSNQQNNQQMGHGNQVQENKNSQRGFNQGPPSRSGYDNARSNLNSEMNNGPMLDSIASKRMAVRRGRG